MKSSVMLVVAVAVVTISGALVWVYVSKSSQPVATMATRVATVITLMVY